MQGDSHLIEALAALESERERLAYALESSRIATWDLDVETGEIRFSVEWSRILGEPPREIRGSVQDELARVPQEDQPALLEAVFNAIKGEVEQYEFDHRVQRADGTVFWNHSRGRVTRRSPDGRALRMNGINADVTPRICAEQALREREERLRLAEQHLRSLTDGVDSLIAHFDLEAQLLFANRRYREWFRIPEDAIPGIPVSAYVGGDAMELLLSHMPLIRRGESVAYEVVRTRGRVTRELEVRLEPQRGTSGEVEGVYAVLNDITARKSIERGLAQQAFTDPVTTLPNRRLLLDRLEVAVARSRRAASPFALLYVDLDGFKPVNDTLGHDAGDELLRRVGERLGSCVRASDTVARVGGDEFALLLDPVASPSDAEAVALKVIAVLEAPFSLTDGQARISASIGIALHPRDGADAAAVIRAADAAMYRAKAAGKARAMPAE